MMQGLNTHLNTCAISYVSLLLDDLYHVSDTNEHVLKNVDWMSTAVPSSLHMQAVCCGVGRGLGTRL